MQNLGTLIITGSGRGIGAATALLAHEKGYAVCVNYVNNAQSAEQIVKTIREQGGRALAVQADVRDASAVKNLFDRAQNELGNLCGLVNNAGVTGKLGRLAETSLSDIQLVLDTNILGAVLCAREAVQRLSTEYGGPGGAIVNITSRAAQYGSPGEFVHYAASKAAVESFSFGLANEVANQGIRVNCVSAGLVDTDLHAAAGDPDRASRYAPRIPMQRAGTAQEIAQAVLWLLSPEASYCTGSVLAVTGGR